MTLNLRQQALLKFKLLEEDKKYLIRFLIEGIGIIGLFAYFFYKSILAWIIMMPFVLFYLKMKIRELHRNKKKQLELQFKEALVSIEGTLRAGKSIENAFLDAYDEMVSYYGKAALISKELEIIKKGLNNNYRLEKLLVDFAERSGIGDIDDFAGILVVGKHTGGNITGILRTYIEIIEQKTSMAQEIDTIISAKKFEQKIMNVVPFFIIFYVDLTSKGFFDCLYKNPAGIIIMTVCMGIYVFAVYLSGKFTEIEV